MAAAANSIFIIIFFFFNLTLSTQGGGSGDVILEEGYEVSTILDGDKSNIKVNPHAIIHQSPPSDLFLLLDSSASTFYTLSFPTTSNETIVQKLAGNGVPSYRDGELGLASFNKPRSFAVDYKGNVYVADQRNHAIRKITKSGVTTIAGGSSQKAGRTDGPARDASFSDDFDLTFIPERCALMISDHGNRLVRQINLKAEDCNTKHSGSGLGTTSAWLLSLGMGLSCLLGLLMGFVIRPYIIPYEDFRQPPPTWAWIHCLTSLERQVMMLCSGSRSVIVNSKIYLLFQKLVILGLSQLSLMLRPITVESRRKRVNTASLLDLDSSSVSISSSNLGISTVVEDQLRDLLTFDGRLMPHVNSNEVVEQKEVTESSDVTSLGDGRKVDGMIVANFLNFEEEASRVCSRETETSECSSGLVKRR